MPNWYKAAQVSVTSGSKIVRVMSGESVNVINAHDSLEIGTFNGRDIAGVETEAGTGDQLIHLVDNWDVADQILQPAKVVPTAVNFNGGATALKNVTESVFAQLSSFSAFATQPNGDVTFKGATANTPDIVVHSIGEWNTILTTLGSQASGVVDNVNAIDAQVNGIGGLIEVVVSIDTTLQGYVSAASNSASTALNNANSTANDRTAINDWVIAVDGWKTAVEAWKTETVTAKNTAVSAKGDVDAGVALAAQYANHPVDTLIPGTTDYSSLHWQQKANAIAGGTAPDALKFGNQSPHYYAKQSDINTLNSLLSSDTTTLDDLQEVVEYIQLNRNTLASLSIVSIVGLPGALDLKADKTQISNLVNTLDLKANKTALDSLQKRVNTMNILNILGF